MLMLVRLFAFVFLAFFAGMMVERGHQRELCQKAGGSWAQAGFCGVTVHD